MRSAEEKRWQFYGENPDAVIFENPEYEYDGGILHSGGISAAAVLMEMPRKYLYVLWLAVAFRLVCPVSVSTEFSLFNLDVFSGQVRGTGGGTMEYFSVSEDGLSLIHI